MTTTNEIRFPVLVDSDPVKGLDFMEPGHGTLSVKITDEGIICDVENSDGEVIATWGVTAQEMADDFCH